MAKSVFVRTEKVAKPVKGQAALVLEALETADGPQTVEQLTETIKSLGLVTRQAPDRITSYYLCIFKKQGIVRVENIEDPVADEDAGDDDADTEDVEETEETEETEEELSEV